MADDRKIRERWFCGKTGTVAHIWAGGRSAGLCGQEFSRDARQAPDNARDCGRCIQAEARERRAR